MQTLDRLIDYVNSSFDRIGRWMEDHKRFTFIYFTTAVILFLFELKG